MLPRREEERPNPRKIRRLREEVQALDRKQRSQLSACSTVHLNKRVRALVKLAIKLFTDIMLESTSDIANNLAFTPRIQYKLDARFGVLNLLYSDPYYGVQFGLALICLAQYRFPEYCLTSEFQQLALKTRDALKQKQLELRGR